MDEDGTREFIATARWRYAWTYRKWAEHWYTRRADAADEAAWTAFARHVWAHGTPMHWKGGTTMVTRYWDDPSGEWMYWVGSPDDDILINRARVRDPDPRTPA